MSTSKVTPLEIPGEIPDKDLSGHLDALNKKISGMSTEKQEYIKRKTGKIELKTRDDIDRLKLFTQSTTDPEIRENIVFKDKPKHAEHPAAGHGKDTTADHHKDDHKDEHAQEWLSPEAKKATKIVAGGSALAFVLGAITHPAGLGVGAAETGLFAGKMGFSALAYTWNQAVAAGAALGITTPVFAAGTVLTIAVVGGVLVYKIIPASIKNETLALFNDSAVPQTWKGALWALGGVTAGSLVLGPVGGVVGYALTNLWRNRTKDSGGNTSSDSHDAGHGH